LPNINRSRFDGRRPDQLDHDVKGSNLLRRKTSLDRFVTKLNLFLLSRWNILTTMIAHSRTTGTELLFDHVTKRWSKWL